MYLKSLELQGFKSFPDKISLTFDEGLTAVVGPNGSGKSNIGDAVRWVLGEQSTKELRGKSMEDVIFSGTKTRKPMGFAFVTLTIDNSDHALSDPEPEVAVTRKLYRSGDSEYLINGKNVRLRDVNELFMDTGLGRDGYAIIGQGRIAEIVGAKSNERRDIFEEAAGVSKFRYKKEEAERMLRAAQDNLLRITDIISDHEMRLGPLSVQAEKAEKYLVLAAERKTLEVSFWVYRLHRLDAQLQTLSDSFLQMSAEYENLERDLHREEEKLELAFRDMQQATVDIEHLQNDIVTAEQENADVTAKIAVCGNEIKHSEEKIAELESRRQEVQLSGDAHSKLLDEQDEYINTLTERVTALEAEISAGEQAISALAEQLAVQTESCTAQDTALRHMMLGRSEAQVRLESILHEIEDTAETIRRAEADGSSVAERLKGYADREKALQKKTAALQGRQQEQINRIEGFRALAESREKKYNQAQQALSGVEITIRQVRQKQQLLRDLEQSMEGYAGSVRQVLRVAGSGRLGGVHGTVAQRITVQPEYGLAIETALGGALQNIIVENEDSAKRCIRYLKENRVGRATFLPLTTIRGSRLSESLAGIDGFVSLACDLVRYDDRYRNVIENLLGRIAVAEDIDAATRIAKQFRYKFRIVTLDGQIIHSGGSFTGGSAAKSAGVITRTHEIEEAAAKLTALTADQERMQAETAKYKAEWAKTLTDLEGAQAQADTLQEELRAVQQEIAALRARAETDMAWQNNEAEQRNRLTEKIALLEETKAAAKAQLAEMDRSIHAAETQLHLDSVEQVKLHSEQEMQTTQLSEKRIRQAAQAKELESERRRRITMAQSMEQAETQLAEIAKEVKQQQTSIAARKREIELLTTGQQTRRESIGEKQRQVQILRQEHDQKEKHTRLLREGIGNLQEAARKQSEDRTRIEERRSRVQQEIDDLVLRLQDAYELTRTEAEQQAEPIEDPKDAETRLTSLRNRIRALGTVNVGAVDEYRELSALHEYMTTQKRDAEQSKEQLESLIATLTEQMCEIFADSFAKINRYFGEIFVELFGGGTASLELTEPDDLLGSGIEIRVAPPGKVIKNLISLSGGEQSFVAICVYFAILKLRPAPFCILDEIDAALDEVNVRKYAQYLKRFLGECQFVVVTHRRSAMDEANVLYGVTMQDGISRLLRLDQNGTAITE